MIETPSIAVIGLGYVGLPLAAALSREFNTIGIDINKARIQELQEGFDRTGELTSGALKDAPLQISHDMQDALDKDIYIITVPTPVDEDNIPDLTAVKKASEAVGRIIKSGAIIVYESTVYPGVTEKICGPILEKISGLVSGQDFYLGYSPERINPGDKIHTVDKITKVVAGQTPEVTQLLTRVYGSMNGGNIYQAKDIPTAEASKVIENAQRDINIAFVNEIALIFEKMGLSVYDVLDAAKTKWNFLPFMPGLVGGHCIGVDPYYLSHAAQQIGIEPNVILSGRTINDGMADQIAERISDLMAGPSKILMLGVTFKENVPDIRNSKIFDLISSLQNRGHDVVAFDPVADKEETQEEYGISLIECPENHAYDAVIGAVPHEDFDAVSLVDCLKEGGLVADIKGIWRNRPLPDSIRRWSL